MVQPFAFALGMLAIPALVGAMRLTGDGPEHAGNLVEYEQLSFEMPEGADYDRERVLEARLPGELGRFQFTPQDLYDQVELPGPTEYDRAVDVDGRQGRDIALLRGGQYLRVVALKGGGVFSMATTEDRRAEADKTFDELIDSIDVH